MSCLGVQISALLDEIKSYLWR